MLFRNEGDVGHQATPCESLPDGRAVADTGRGWEGRAHEAQNFTSFLHISFFFWFFKVDPGDPPLLAKGRHNQFSLGENFLGSF